MLRNPLADGTGVNVFYEVNLEAATRTEEFNLAGGLSESAFAEHIENQSETMVSGARGLT